MEMRINPRSSHEPLPFAALVSCTLKHSFKLENIKSEGLLLPKEQLNSFRESSFSSCAFKMAVAALSLGRCKGKTAEAEWLG
jgi:hypothetical protein